VSLLDSKGRPGVTERVFVLPPASQLGPISAAQRQALLQSSLVAGVYEKTVNRESAHEMLSARVQETAATAAEAESKASGGALGGFSDLVFGSTGPRGGQRDGVAQMLVKSAVRTMGSTVGREIIRGVLGGIFGGKGR
jgi:hypothetical protein